MIPGFSGLFILDDNGNPVPISDALQWAKWFNKTERRIVAKTEIDPGVEVSTVFLGLDHNYAMMSDPMKYKPVLWETMVFGGVMDQFQCRYNSLENAKAGHAEVVKQAEAEQARLRDKTPEERSMMRPEDYETLSPEDQWQVDKKLGILDWDGKSEVEIAGASLRLRLIGGRRFRPDE